MQRLAAEEELQRRLSQELGDRVRLGGFVYPLLIVILGLQTSIPQEHSLVYWSGLIVTLIGSVWRLSAANKLKKAATDWQNVREELRVATLLLAGAWSTLTVLGLAEYANRDVAVIYLFGLIGWASAGANLFAPDSTLAQAFIHLNMIPALIWCLMVRGRFGWVTAAMFMMTWVFLIILTRWNHRYLRRMIQTQIQLETQAEELLAAKDASEQATLARTQFIATMSHEIRTPLNGIIGVAEILRETHLDPEQRELVAIMNQSGQLLISLINDLLDLSKINAGKLQLELREFDIRRLIEEVGKPLQAAAEEKGLEWRIKVRREVPEICIGDPMRLRQVLNNLMSNALKFTDAGGVTVELGMSDGNHMRFVIEDTGIGIEASKLDAIFEEFEQADHTTTRRYGGSGLGLAIAKKLVELMGGRIGVQSVPGHGSLFWFEIGVVLTTSETR